MRHRIYNPLLLVISLLSTLLLMSCSSRLMVTGEYPKPLVPQMPYSLAVVYEEAFKNYQYVESSENRDEWEIQIGPAQTKLFGTVLPAMFSRVIEMPAIDNKINDTDVDLIMLPVLSEFQYNLPSETKVKMFEVWMKYNVKIYEPDGELIADWIMTAYGKTPTGMIQTKESALNEAMNVALRDAGANLSLTFARVPEIRAWMKRKETSKL